MAHGIPGDRVIAAGDLVNIDVSAELDGVFADTGASFLVASGDPRLAKLCRDGKRAMWEGIRAVRSEAPMAGIGTAIGKLRQAQRLYAARPTSRATAWATACTTSRARCRPGPTASERRRIPDGIVFTVEPFLSLGAREAIEAEPHDGFTLLGAAGRADRAVRAHHRRNAAGGGGGDALRRAFSAPATDKAPVVAADCG